MPTNLPWKADSFWESVFLVFFLSIHSSCPFFTKFFLFLLTRHSIDYNDTWNQLIIHMKLQLPENQFIHVEMLLFLSYTCLLCTLQVKLTTTQLNHCHLLMSILIFHFLFSVLQWRLAWFIFSFLLYFSREFCFSFPLIPTNDESFDSSPLPSDFSSPTLTLADSQWDESIFTRNSVFDVYTPSFSRNQCLRTYAIFCIHKQTFPSRSTWLFVRLSLFSLWCSESRHQAAAVFR